MPRPPPPPRFTCPICGRTSYHPTDVKEGYCGACTRGRASPSPAVPRPPSVQRATARRITEARRSGRLGEEHEAEVAVALRLAATLTDPRCPPTAQAAISRQLVAHLRALGLAPVAAAPSDLEALLAELRGDD